MPDPLEVLLDIASCCASIVFAATVPAVTALAAIFPATTELAASSSELIDPSTITSPVMKRVAESQLLAVLLYAALVSGFVEVFTTIQTSPSIAPVGAVRPVAVRTSASLGAAVLPLRVIV